MTGDRCICLFWQRPIALGLRVKLRYLLSAGSLPLIKAVSLDGSLSRLALAATQSRVMKYLMIQSCAKWELKPGPLDVKSNAKPLMLPPLPQLDQNTFWPKFPTTRIFPSQKICREKNLQRGWNSRRSRENEISLSPDIFVCFCFCCVERSSFSGSSWWWFVGRIQHWWLLLKISCIMLQDSDCESSCPPNIQS